MPAWAFFLLGLVSGQVVLLAVLALCSMAADADRRIRERGQLWERDQLVAWREAMRRWMFEDGPYPGSFLAWSRRRPW